MSYCRFENTYKDLQDCLEALENDGGITGVEKDSNDYEKPYVRKLVELCREIADDYEDELEEECYAQHATKTKNKTMDAITKTEIDQVEELGDEMGYGELMCIASALWRRKLKDQGFPITGAFVPSMMHHVSEEMKKITKEECKEYDERVAKVK